MVTQGSVPQYNVAVVPAAGRMKSRKTEEERKEERRIEREESEGRLFWE